MLQAAYCLQHAACSLQPAACCMLHAAGCNLQAANCIQRICSVSGLKGAALPECSQFVQYSLYLLTQAGLGTRTDWASAGGRRHRLLPCLLPLLLQRQTPVISPIPVSTTVVPPDSNKLLLQGILTPRKAKLILFFTQSKFEHVEFLTKKKVNLDKKKFASKRHKLVFRSGLAQS